MYRLRVLQVSRFDFLSTRSITCLSIVRSLSPENKLEGYATTITAWISPKGIAFSRKEYPCLKISTWAKI